MCCLQNILNAASLRKIRQRFSQFFPVRVRQTFLDEMVRVTFFFLSFLLEGLESRFSQVWSLQRVMTKTRFDFS